GGSSGGCPGWRGRAGLGEDGWAVEATLSGEIAGGGGRVEELERGENVSCSSWGCACDCSRFARVTHQALSSSKQKLHILHQQLEHHFCPLAM
uniref:Uncharacterized protein n=1 Tax=Triticum urartu TaxID=4572 RepID=A0A8R7QH60_TRIUA